MPIFLAVVLTISGLIHWFLYSRFVAAFSITSPAWLWTLRGVAAFLAVSYMVVRWMEFSPLPKPLIVAGNWLASVWLGLMLQFLWIGLLVFVIHLLLLLTGVWQGFPFEQQTWISRMTGFGAIALALLLGGYGIWRACAPAVINEYTVRAKGVTPEIAALRIAHIADTHAGVLVGERQLGRMVAQVQAQKPDLILIPGDIIDAPPHLLQGLIPVFQKLDAPLGVFGTTGNHEYYIGINPALDLLRKSEIRLLNNEHVELPGGLVIAGIVDRTARGMGLPRPDVSELVGGIAKDKPVILLNHTPQTDEVIRANQAGADLVICGHTHGGQVWPFRYLVQLSFKFIHGLYDTGFGTVITTCGLGYWGPPMRIGAPPEINIIRLVNR